MSTGPAPEDRRFRPSASVAEVEKLRKFLAEAIERGASDIHIRAGDVVYARIGGQLTPLDTPTLTAVSTYEMVTHILGTSSNAPSIEDVRDYSGPWSAPGIARFRVSILKQRSSFAIVMRVIPDVLPTLEGLGLPAVIGQAVLADFGLFFVSGVPGSGRASTIAALIHHLNTHSPRRRHIVAIETAIEFLHRNNKCAITQREVGVDTDSFADGMRAALDQDADIIVVGEMNDPEIIELAVRAAEAGRLVIGKMSAPDATGALRQFLAGLPSEQQDTARLHVTEMLRAVVAQRLLPRSDGQGRVLACEILLMTPLVRDVLGDPGRLAEIRQTLADGRAEFGTQTFDQQLADLVISGQVSFEVALTLATNSLDFELQLRGLRR
ncbi:MAG: PilT/PilU family type 4a pilus ATPase [Gemmatimonadetes bacterium]|nr:PilT/PilU family type 4a pilus ATPase [Gemmatimonadota bacterium]